MLSAFMIIAIGGLITFFLPCVTPFGALATCAVLRGGTRSALIVVSTAWALNETAGFAMFHYPQTADSYAWAALSLVAAVVATVFASWIAHALRNLPSGLRGFAVLSIATVGFELALASGAFASGRSLGGFSLDIDVLVVETNFIFFVAFEAAALLGRTIGARWSAKHV